ncbi:elongation factor P [Candidatus Ishikawella capsulata]|uniref:Elongation factor P n=1 Tax=Candidatus Ishikawaella capsulata Mpkobe TaxID=476281 RepID=C5WCH0_9ENTR|nr:elongation factor P [Candidatus Ishikawaella capsulata]BAH83026.1 elongation factor P [Candidatus Ishikawaella capsulata Mpkobe]
MTTYSSSHLRNGIKILYYNEPYVIESSEFVKPGKGQAFTRVKMRRLLTGTRIEKTFKSTDLFEKANVIEIILNYSYKDARFFYFMHPETFEFYQIESKILENIHKWLQPNAECVVTLWNDKVIVVQPPNFIISKVINTDPGIKGDTAASVNKLAILETGAIVKVPLFVQVNEVIRVDTRSGEYVSRVKL